MARVEERSTRIMWSSMVDQESGRRNFFSVLRRVSEFPLIQSKRTLTIPSLAVTLYFVIPRAPSFEFYHDQPFTVNNDTISFNRMPTNFSFSGNLNLWGTLSSDIDLSFNLTSTLSRRRVLFLCPSPFHPPRSFFVRRDNKQEDSHR